MRSSPALVVWCLAVGCDEGGQSGENSDEICGAVTYTAGDRTDTTLGFSADEVAGGLPLPVEVSWTEFTLDASGSRVESTGGPEPLAFQGLTIAGPVQVADLAGAPQCYPEEPRRALVIPLALEIRAGVADEVQAVGIVQVWAFGADPASVLAIPDGDLLPAELSGSYADALDAWWAAYQADHSHAEDFRIEAISVVLSDPWDQLQLDIGVDRASSDTNGSSALWRGVVGFE